MPRQGNTVESCVIVDWKVKEGDTVTADTPVCDVETDKATFEVPAGAAGTVLKLLYQVGDDVPVLQPIAVIGQVGEDWQTVVGTKAATEDITDVSPDATTVTADATAVHPNAKAATAGESSSAISKKPSNKGISPRAKKTAREQAIPVEGIQGSGPGGRVIEQDILANVEERGPLTAAARALLQESQNTQAVPPIGSGPAGRITSRDLQSPEKFSEKQQFEEKHENKQNIEQRKEIPIKGIRKVIADRMHESLATTAQFTLSTHASAVRLQELRKRYKQTGDSSMISRITVNDLVLFVVSRLLLQYSYMNAHKIEDTLITFDAVHLGMAVDTPRGLMVPVIRNAHQLSLVELSAEAKRLAAACSNGTITSEELSGSTFTVTNLGALGIENFTPVLNIPEVAILGACGIEPRPVITDASSTDYASSIRFEPQIGFSLTINHQVVDGAPAARFLKALCEAVAQIDLWLAY
jgi:pyruvate dehydrogenase E2 component (dihydrolipoamide acetyltransferase)